VPKQDWSLVIFTTFSQLSVGIILCLTLLGFSLNDMSLFIEMGLSLKNPVLLALVFVGVATLLSFLHLGNPTNAPNALNNLSGSWLSREILALSVYSLCLLVTFVLGWKTGNIEYLWYPLLLSSVAGIALLWMMIRIYVVATIPAWNSWYTPMSFVSTTLCLGLLTFLVLHHLGMVNIADQIINKIAVLLIVILFLETASGFSHQSQLKKMNTGIDALVFDQGEFYRVFLARMGILIITFLAMFIITLKPDLLAGSTQHVWMFTLFILIVVQELMGRLLFYSSYFRIGV